MRTLSRRPLLCTLPTIALSLLLPLSTSTAFAAQVHEYDLLKASGLEVNAAGPVLLKADADHSRVVVANALSSTLTFIDDETNAVRNLPVGARTLQHLKAEALALRPSDGAVYLIGDHALIVEDPTSGQANTLWTTAQFEALALDDATGNALLVGRETGKIGFYKARDKKLRLLDWLADSEPLKNLNQSPPPPIRRVVSLPPSEPGKAGSFAAIDGVGARLYLFDADSGKLLSSRDLPLTPGGRWHLAGVQPSGRSLFLVTETNERKVLQAARVSLDGGQDQVLALPGFMEGVAMIYDPVREKVYINYDNHSSIHVVDFAGQGSLSEIAIPSFGNDAAVLDSKGGRLYIASWARGEIDVVDLEKMSFAKRFENLGILPHMHAMAFDPSNGDLYFPRGATGVNGVFGASVTRLDPETGKVTDILTGFAPIDLIDVPERGSLFVFSNEGRYAEIKEGSPIEMRDLPHPWPISSWHGPGGQLQVHYGPHQSYWPVVYIWGARNGILGIDPKTLDLYDRRIPRQALGTFLDPQGMLWMAQNNWGKEKAFVGRLDGGVREFDIGARIELPDEVERETTQRLLGWDESTKRLLLARVGEEDSNPGVLHVIDPERGLSERRLELGSCPVDMVVGQGKAWIANFGSNDVSIVELAQGTATRQAAGKQPLHLALLGERVFVVDHAEPVLREIGGRNASWKLPIRGRADNLSAWGERLVIAAHGPSSFELIAIDPKTGAIERLVDRKQAYGQIGFDTGNSAFYLCGQYGDAVFTLSPTRITADGKLAVADFLSGRVYVIE